jgi:hypothetical protein
MAKVATALDGAHFDVADAQGKEAQQPLDQLWLALSSTDAAVGRGVRLAKDVVAKDEALAPEPDAQVKQAAALRLAEIDERLAKTADVLAPKAQRQLEGIEKQPPATAPAPVPPNPAPDPNGPPGPPAPDPEALKRALARTVEVGPQVADLARAAQQALATPDFVQSLKSEKEALALLEELEKHFPKSKQDDKKDEKKDDEKKNEDKKQDEKKGDDSKKGDDKKDPGQDGKGDEKKPGMSPDQVQALLRRAAERAKQKQQEKKDAEESVLVPVRVDRDW